MMDLRTGNEAFHRDRAPVGPRRVDFWRWANSDLLGNALRGVIAEYLVATDIGMTPGGRVEWAAYDLLTGGYGSDRKRHADVYVLGLGPWVPASGLCE
jgi:hypothetical protein